MPEIPAPFLPHLLEDGGGTANAKELAERGEESLGRALRQSGRSREAAFHLLAADAFLTYACEVLAWEGDVRSGLEDLLQHLGDRFS